MFWHNKIIDFVERCTSQFNSYLWTKRWGDRSLYQSDQKKKTLRVKL